MEWLTNWDMELLCPAHHLSMFGNGYLTMPYKQVLRGTGMGSRRVRATLNEIENFLNIETADKRLRADKKYNDNNKYYYYNELHHIVELTQGEWMICSDNKETRQLL